MIPNPEEAVFLKVLKDITKSGFKTMDRTGVGTHTLVGIPLKYDLTDGKLPLWTTRKIRWENQFWELIWFLRGQTDVAWLADKKVNGKNIAIWDYWKKADGTIGPGYGKQWRRWSAPDYSTYKTSFVSPGYIFTNPPAPERHTFELKTIDQFTQLIEGIRNNPFSRRHIVTLWNPADIDECVLPPCHGDVIQFVVDDKRGLHCLQYQRSADIAVGYCPWQYAMLTHIVAKLTDTTPASLSCMIGNAHVYLNQFEAVEQQYSRSPTEAPTFGILKDIKTIEDVENLQIEDVEVSNYNPQAFIKFPIAI